MSSSTPDVIVPTEAEVNSAVQVSVCLLLMKSCPFFPFLEGKYDRFLGRGSRNINVRKARYSAEMDVGVCRALSHGAYVSRMLSCLVIFLERRVNDLWIFSVFVGFGWVIQEGVEPEKTEQPGNIEPPSVGDMDQGSNRRGSVRLNTFETMLDPAEIVSTLTTVRTSSRINHFLDPTVYFPFRLPPEPHIEPQHLYDCRPHPCLLPLLVFMTRLTSPLYASDGVSEAAKVHPLY